MLADCRREPKAVVLPSVNGFAYETLLETFDDGAADKPFRLLVRASGSRDDPKQILFAEQCKNVSIIAAPDTLYVFYDELALTEFGSFQYNQWEPRIRLCDRHFKDCADAERQLPRAGLKRSNVCTYTTADVR